MKQAKMMSIILVNLCSLSFSPFGNAMFEFRISNSIFCRIRMIWKTIYLTLTTLAWSYSENFPLKIALGTVIWSALFGHSIFSDWNLDGQRILIAVVWCGNQPKPLSMVPQPLPNELKPQPTVLQPQQIVLQPLSAVLQPLSAVLQPL